MHLEQRSAVPGKAARWLLFGLLASLVLVAAFDAAEPVRWMAYVAAGALGALLLTGLRGRSEHRTLARQVRSGWETLQTELARSRRHDRRFVIVGVPGEVWTPPGGGQSDRDEAALRAAEAVQGILRRPDRTWPDGSMLLVLLTDSDRVAGQGFLQRARSTMPQVFADPRVRLVAFPDDGVTLGALLATIRGDVGEDVMEPVLQ
jgi:hypothetical protein